VASPGGKTELDRSDENTAACFAAGGAPDVTAGQWYLSCDFPSAECPCVERFRPGSWDCPEAAEWTPAEAPEGGMPGEQSTAAGDGGEVTP
jgi:hypothetical protein